MADDSSLSTQSILDWRVWLPAVLMTVVAVVQVYLATTADLMAWKGGGFGMFATVDGPGTRRVRVFVDGPGRSEEVGFSRSQQTLEKRSRVFPTDLFLTPLAEGVAEREQRAGRPISTVRVEAWRADFNDKLEGTDRLLRTFSLNVDPKAHDTR